MTLASPAHIPSRHTRRPTESELRERLRGAWRELKPASAVPQDIEILIRKKKSAVCRFMGPDGPLIAKRARKRSGVLEHQLHVRILSRLPIRSLRWHGIVDLEEDPTHCWLFMEDAGQPRDPLGSMEDQPLVSAWLAALHATSSGSEGLADLPDRGPADALRGLRISRDVIVQSLADPDQPEVHSDLDPILRELDVLEGHWHEIEARCEEIPRTLVHGDFVPKNMCVGEGPDGRELRVFDWEHTGVGFPGQDLTFVDPAHYGVALREHWTGIDEPWLRRLHATGGYFRLLAEIRWAAKCLSLPGSEYSVVALQRYARQLEASVRAAGWGRSRS